MSAFEIIERGEFNGTPYRVVVRKVDGWKRVFLGEGACRRRHNMGWLNKRKRLGTVNVTYVQGGNR